VILILFSLLVPLGFIFAGVWDGRDVVVIFWIESMIVFFFSVVRLSLVRSESYGTRFGRVCVNGILLTLVWIWLGDQLSADILQKSSRSAISINNVLALIEFLLNRSGSLAIFVLIAMHAFEVIFRRKRSKEYREASADHVGKDMWKRILPLYFVPLFGSTPGALGNHFKVTTAAVLLAVGLALFRAVFEIVLPWLVTSAPERASK